MSHARKLIRQAVVALLAGGSTAAGARVYDHPNAARTTFPALVVEDAGEQQAPKSMPAGPGRTIERSYAFVVSAEVKQLSGYAEQRDDLLAQVEVLLATAGIGGVKSITPTLYMPDMDNTGEYPIVVGRQRFEALYYTEQGAPGTTL